MHEAAVSKKWLLLLHFNDVPVRGVFLLFIRLLTLIPVTLFKNYTHHILNVNYVSKIISVI